MVLGHALAHDRVRSHTADKRNARLDVETERRVQAYRSASEAELAEAKAILSAWETRTADVISLNGKMIDQPVVERARRLIASQQR